MSAVLTKTAVFGSHHKIHVQIFAKASQRTSLSLLNLTFVIFSAILADIIVSIIAIIHTTNEILTSHFAISKNSQKLLKLSVDFGVNKKIEKEL